ncbi:hypothetical protein [Flagellimonas sp.]|uniref:hypothetical protein n=1 Tax=Flagellimonas sp. TaxID=2058762 RepID=UPI003AB59654
MKITFETRDFEIGVVHCDGPLVQLAVPVTFSAWDANQDGAFFATEFFRKRGWTACFVRAKWNHWWHCDDIRGALEELAADHGNIFFYGASMGGYGALYYSRMLDCPGISFSPQGAVAPDAIPQDNRWLYDRSKLSPVFDEKEVLASTCTRPAYCFSDMSHALDKLHSEYLQAHAGPNSKIEMLDAPHTFHQTIRAAQRSGLLECLLSGLCGGARVDTTGLRTASANMFKSTVKGRADNLRRRGNATSEEVSAILNGLDQKKLDFEEAYMLAELCSAVGMNETALALSWQSVDLNPTDYVLVKHAKILRQHLGKEFAYIALSLYADHLKFGAQSAALMASLADEVATTQ